MQSHSQKAPNSRTDISAGSIRKREQAVPNMQAKLTIGQPNDKYEQEADRVADQVVNSIPGQKEG